MKDEDLIRFDYGSKLLDVYVIEDSSNIGVSIWENGVYNNVRLTPKRCKQLGQWLIQMSER